MRRSDPSETSRRLKRAIEIAGTSVKQLHLELKKREVRGAARSMIHRYLNGEKTPPLPFLEIAADILGVRAAWLVSELGAPTDDEERRRLEADAVTNEVSTGLSRERDRERFHAEEFKVRVLAALGFAPPMEPADVVPSVTDGVAVFKVIPGEVPYWVAALAEVQRRHPSPISPTIIGMALRGPLEALEIDWSNAVRDTYQTEDWLNDYITFMTPALLALATAPRME